MKQLRQKTKDRIQKAKGKRQKAKGKRQKRGADDSEHVRSQKWKLLDASSECGGDADIGEGEVAFWSLDLGNSGRV